MLLPRLFQRSPRPSRAPAPGRRRGRALVSALPWSACLALSAAAPSASAITGVCPDGSIYIVQQRHQIPCPESKQVAPSDVPPLRPDYLPEPYTWRVWNERNNPNNPYNLIDSAEQVRQLHAAPPNEDGSLRESAAVAPGGGLPSVGAAPQPSPDSVGPLDLGLGDAELRDLFLIVELSQQRAPARIARKTADGRGVFEVNLARSAAFEQRLRQAWHSRGALDDGQVVVFTAHSKRPEEFFANFTFVQGHMTFQPDRESARQLGILQGRLGALDGGEVVLGYVVLPASIDLANELDVYWNDRHTAVVFGG